MQDDSFSLDWGENGVDIAFEVEELGYHDPTQKIFFCVLTSQFINYMYNLTIELH